MATGRYINSPRINLGVQLGTPEDVLLLRRAVRDGSVPVIRQVILTGADRLDSLAGTIFGDAKYWWVLAASSGIGWGLQVPPGTVINVVRLEDALNFVR
jgi:hypothetical protein